MKQETLKEKTARGLFWGALNSGTTQLLNLVFGIVVGRLLSPADYGLVGLLTIFSLIAQNLQSSGFSTAIVNMRHPRSRDYNAVFWFNILVSFALYGVLFLVAPLIARFFHQPPLVPLSRLVFLAFVISSFGISTNAYMTKNMMQREMAIVNALALVLSGTTAVVLALNGMAYWSIAWQQVVNAAVLVVGRFWFVKWRPSWQVDFTPIRQTFSFSVKILVTMIVTTVSQNLLTFIFGRLYSIKAVGNFSQAQKWNTMAYSLVSGTVVQVAQPVLVAIRDDADRELNVFRKMTRFTSLLSFPAMFGMALVAHEFIVGTIGPQWEDAVPLLQILCIGGAFMPFYTLYQNLVISHGRSDVNMWLNILQIAIQLSIVAALHGYGIETMVVVYTAFNIVWLLLWQVFARRLIGLRFVDMAKDVVPFMLIAAAVMTCTHYLTLFIGNCYLLLAARVALGGGLYVAVMKTARVHIMDECLQFILAKFKKP